MIDELLQLGKLDEYQDRMDNARVGVDRVRRAQETKLSSIQDEIAALEEEGLFGQ
jgi:exonuclease SbcC